MISDEERREVARRLREVQSDVIPGTKTEVHPIAGRIIGVACGYDLPDFQGLLGHLADLIEPSCDRDALLRLARYMDKDVAETEAHFSNVISTKSVSDYARRIREACGVAE